MTLQEITLKFVEKTGLKLVSNKYDNRAAYYIVLSPTGVKLCTAGFFKENSRKDEEDAGWHFWFVKDFVQVFELE